MDNLWKKVAISLAMTGVLAVGVSAIDNQTELVAAIDSAGNGDTITLTGNFDLDMNDVSNNEGILTIDKAITLDGGGNTVTITNDNGNGNNVSAITITSDNVTIENLTIDGDNTLSRHGLNIYVASGIEVHNVSLLNCKGYGLMVNGSDVTASNLTITGSGWGDINVTRGSGVSTEPSLALTGTNVVGAIHQDNVDNAQPLMSNVNIDDNNTWYPISWTKDSTKPFISWYTDESNVSSCQGRNETTGLYYYTLADALTAATAGDTITLVADAVLSSTVTIPAGVLVTVPVDVALTTEGATIVGAVVSFEANGGTGSASAVLVASGEGISTLPTASRSGYSFLGWYHVDTNDTLTTEDTFVSDANYIASWNKNSTSTNTGTMVTTTTTTTTTDDDTTEDVTEETTDVEDTTETTLSPQESINLEATGYTDVAPDDWYADAVEYAVSSNLFQGTSDTGFSPNTAMSREMTWVVLARLNGEEMSGATAYAEAKVWAEEMGITDGSNPSGNVTREQLVTLLWRNAGSPEMDGDLSNYDDADEISDYAQLALAWAIENGVISGMDAATLNPTGEATRAQVAQIMMNLH